MLLVILLGGVGIVLLLMGDKRNPGAKRAAYVMLAVAALFLLATLLPEPPPAPPKSKWSVHDVRAGCQEQVSTKLLSPRSMRPGDDFYRTDPRWSPGNLTWSFSFDVEAQNAFGVWLPSRWLCEVIDDEWVSVTQLR